MVLIDRGQRITQLEGREIFDLEAKAQKGLNLNRGELHLLLKLEGTGTVRARILN